MSKKQSSSEDHPHPFDLEKMFNPNEVFLGALPEWQPEIMRFFGQRWKHYLELPKQLSECQRQEEIYELQANFFSRMRSDYREHAKLVSVQIFEMAQPLVEKKDKQQTNSQYEKTISSAQKEAEKIIEQAKQNAANIIEDAKVRAEKAIEVANEVHSKVA